MPIDRSFIGREFAADEPSEVTRGKIREFADAIGDDSPAYRDPAAARALGYHDVIAPPTFAIVVIASAADKSPIFEPAFGLNYSMTVHGEQAFTYRRPIQAGDVLSVRSTIADISAVKRNELVRIDSELRDADGELVCVAENVLVSRGTAATEELS